MLKEAEVKGLEALLGGKINMIVTTLEHIDPLGAPKGPAAERDDWEQYGGYPGQTPESTQRVETVLMGIKGYKEGDEVHVTHIVGEENGVQKDYALKQGEITYISAVHGPTRTINIPKEILYEEIDEKLVDFLYPAFTQKSPDDT